MELVEAKDGLLLATATCSVGIATSIASTATISAVFTGRLAAIAR